MQRSIMIAPATDIDVETIANALRSAGMSVAVNDRILIVHQPVRDLDADISDYADLPAFLKPQAGPLFD